MEMIDEEGMQDREIPKIHHVQESTANPQELETEIEENFDYYELQELLEDQRLLEHAMEDRERPEKRRKIEDDKGDGVLPVPSRSPRVVLNKIKLKEDVLERLRKIKKLAKQEKDKVKDSLLPTSVVPEKEAKECQTEQEKSASIENKELPDDTWDEQKQKRKRENEEEEHQPYVAKAARVNPEAVAKETQIICEPIEKKDADRVSSGEHSIDKHSGEYDDKKEKKLVPSEASNSKEPTVSKATQSKGDEVIKAAQNYAKSGAQTEPKQDKLPTDDKLVVIVTEVLEEGNSRTPGALGISEQETSVDNNNLGEQVETLSGEDEPEEDEDCMTNAIYQLIKDVVKNRTEYFESALLRENKKLEERVLQLEKQNTLLQRVGYRLDYTLKEITRKRREARQSLISRGTQVNMNLQLSRTSSSTSKSSTVEIDVLEEAKDTTGSPQPKSNSVIPKGRNTSRVLTSMSRKSFHSETIVSKTSSPSSSTVSKPDENRLTNSQPGKNKCSSGSEVISVSQNQEPMRNVSTSQQQEQQDTSSYKKLQPGMGHFRLSPNYKRAAQQQSAKEDTIETGHFRITPAGLLPQNRSSSQRLGNSSVNEPSHVLVATRPSPSPASPRAQKMDSAISESSPISKSLLSISNSNPSAVSSKSTLRKSQSPSTSFLQEVTLEERSLSSPASSIATKNPTVDNLDRRSQASSIATVPARPSPPSLINTKTTRVSDLERKSQTSSTSTVPSVSRTSPSSQLCTLTREPSESRYVSTERIESSHQKKESENNKDPDIVIVSQTTISSPKEQTKKVLRNDKVGSQVEISTPCVQISNEKQVQVRINRVDNQSVPKEGPPPSYRQRSEVVTTSKQQNPQGVNEQLPPNQQVVLCTYKTTRVNTVPRDNIPPLRSCEPQQHVRYVMRDDRSRVQMVKDQPRQVDKVQNDPRHTQRYVLEARGQPQMVREQAMRPTDKTPTAVRYDPKQPPRYIIQEGPPQLVHERSPRPVLQEGPMQPRQPVLHQQALPPGAVGPHQQQQSNAVSTAGSKVIGPRPPLIGIQDVRTQQPQPYQTQQQPQQHIIVNQNPPVQNPQHPHQYQHVTYQYQQPQQLQHRPTLPQQQNVPRTQAPVYYAPQTLQQVPPRINLPTGYQPRPAVLPQGFVTNPIPPQRATGNSNVSIGGPIRTRQPLPDVVYRPGALEGSTVRPPAPMPPHGYDRFQPRPAYVQQRRQPQINNQGIQRPMIEQQMPRPSSQEAATYVQAREQRIQERRAQGETPPEQTQISPANGRRDSLHQPSPPKPTASIAIVENGIVLSWNITTGESIDNIECYELFACQDDSNSTLPPILWKKIGVVKALPLPMACTLTQFSSGSRYQFAVRAVDTSERAGPFSDSCVITLKR